MKRSPTALWIAVALLGISAFFSTNTQVQATAIQAPIPIPVHIPSPPPQNPPHSPPSSPPPTTVPQTPASPTPTPQAIPNPTAAMCPMHVCTIISRAGEKLPDTDCDGIVDTLDNCPHVANSACDATHYPGNFAGCDINCDGTLDSKERAAGSQADFNRDGIGDACEDSDGDGVLDYQDNCKVTPNPDQMDRNLNGIGDACENLSHDGTINVQGNCSPNPDANQSDVDQDGISDACDNCPYTPNADQADSAHDGIGDACRGDWDADGVPDATDNCPNVPNPDQADDDHDGYGNMCDNCPQVSNPDQLDSNRNGIGDACPLGVTKTSSAPSQQQPSTSPGGNSTTPPSVLPGFAPAHNPCPQFPNSNQPDSNHNNVADVCEPNLVNPDAAPYVNEQHLRPQGGISPGCALSLLPEHFASATWHLLFVVLAFEMLLVIAWRRHWQQATARNRGPLK